MNEKYYEIGSRTPIEGGAVFSAGSTDNGYCYKSEKAIKEHSGVCYITEHAFTDHDKELQHDEEGNLIVTPDNIATLVDWGYVITWHSARESAQNHIDSYEFGCFNRKVVVNSADMWDLYQEFIDHIAEGVLECVDWQGVDTLLNEWDLYEELASFLQEKFVEFAKERIKQDGDDTDIDDPVFEENLFGFLGYECYRDDDFNLTDWDTLIDRWENEPNY